MRRAFLTVVTALSAGCAGYSQASNAPSILGSSAALEPHVLAATAMPYGKVSLLLEVPVRSYVTTILVLPGRGVWLLTQSQAGDADPVPMEAGKHRVLLQDAPLALLPTMGRTAMQYTKSYGEQYSDATKLQTFYTVVVATPTPLTWAGVKHALDPISIDGKALEVNDRVANALGVASAGQWGATAAPVANTR